MALLSPGRSSMRVAGTKKESFYECPGDMLYFDAVHVYHRSGLACARTLKIAFFVKLTGSAPVTIDLIGDDGGSSRSSKMDTPVKLEQAKKEPKVKEEELEGEEEEPAAVVAGPPKKQFVSSELKPPSSASPSVQGGAAAPLAAATDKNPSKEDADESKEDAEPSQETEVVAVAPPQETEEKKTRVRARPACFPGLWRGCGRCRPPPAMDAAQDTSSTADAVTQKSSGVGEVVPPAAQAAAQAAPQEGEKNKTKSDSSPVKPAISSGEGGADEATEEMYKTESMAEGGGSSKDESKNVAEPSQETEVVAAAPPQETEEKKHESARDPPAAPASGEVVGDAAPSATDASQDISSTADAVPQESSAVGEVVPPAAQAAAQAAPQEGEENNTKSGASPEKPAISSVEGGADEDMDKKESMEEGGGSPKDSPSSGKKRTRQASQSGSELQGEDGTPGKGSKEIKVKQEGKKPDPKPKRKHKAGK